MEEYNKTFNINDHLLASVVYFSLDSIIVTKKDLDEPGPEIVYVNPGFTKMTGYPPEEVIGRSPRILQGPKTDRQVIRRLKETLLKGDIFHGEAINYRKDGSEFWIEWHIEPIRDNKGSVIYFLAIQRDVTQRKLAEQSILQKNNALYEILEQIQLEKNKIKKEVELKVEKILLPSLKKIQRKGTKLDKRYLDIFEQTLNELTSSFGSNVSEKGLKLSPREVEISNMIKRGLGSKEICQILNISSKTIETHRNKIRKKLGIINQDINLTGYLQKL